MIYISQLKLRHIYTKALEVRNNYLLYNLQIHEQVLRHGRLFQLGQAVLHGVNIRNIVGNLVHPDIASLLNYFLVCLVHLSLY